MSWLLGLGSLVSLVLFASGMGLALSSIPEGSNLVGCVLMLVGLVGLLASGLAWGSRGGQTRHSSRGGRGGRARSVRAPHISGT